MATNPQDRKRGTHTITLEIEDNSQAILGFQQVLGIDLSNFNHVPIYILEINDTVVGRITSYSFKESKTTIRRVKT